MPRRKRAQAGAKSVQSGAGTAGIVPSMSGSQHAGSVRRCGAWAAVHALVKNGRVDPADEVGRVDQLLGLDPGRVAVVLVDLQRDFCGPPGVAVERAGTVANALAARRADAFAAEAAQFGVRVLDTERLTPRQRRWEVDSRLCVAGSVGAELFVAPLPGARVVRKHRFDIWQSREFLDALTDWDIDGLVIGGVELQCCVLYAVLGAEERGFHYVVPQDLVSGIDRCETTSNRAVREYLRLVHPSPESSEVLLAGWRERLAAT
jgi:nicotinamidase-related amidase